MGAARSLRSVKFDGVVDSKRPPTSTVRPSQNSCTSEDSLDHPLGSESLPGSLANEAKPTAELSPSGDESRIGSRSPKGSMCARLTGTGSMALGSAAKSMAQSQSYNNVHKAGKQQGSRRDVEPPPSAVKVLTPEDLGVAFHTRALSHSSHSRFEPLRSLLSSGRLHGGDSIETVELARLYPQAECQHEPKWFRTISTKLRLSSNGIFRHFGDFWYKTVPFSSSSWAAQRILWLLEASGVLSCAFVLASLAVEPLCMQSQKGSVIDRNQIGSQTFLICLHTASSAIYTILSIISYMFIGIIDKHRGEELVVVADVVHYQVRSIGLWLDLLSYAGFIAELVHLGEATGNGTPSGAHWIMALQVGKIWRVIIPQVKAAGGSSSFFRGVCNLFFSLAYIAHVMACVLLIIGAQESAVGQISWTDNLLRDGEITCEEVYTEAFYFAVLSLTSVGYGDLLMTTLERAVNAGFLLLGQLFTTKVCADLTWLTSTHNHEKAEHEELRAQTRSALENMHVPKELSDRVLAFQSFKSFVHREDLSQPLFMNLSANLVQELHLVAYRKLVLEAVFLREQPKEVIGFVVGSLVDTVYLPADFIIRTGDKGRDLYFVRRGYAAVFAGSEPPLWGVTPEITTYHSGSYFGELAMLTGKPRAAWIMATTYCVCSILPYHAVEQLCREAPSSFTSLVQSMIQIYNLKASRRWFDVIEELQEKYKFPSAEDAYIWMSNQDGDVDEEELSCRAFVSALRKVKVPLLDRKIFWAEIDEDASGTITFQEFCEVLPEGLFRVLTREAASGPRRERAASTGQIATEPMLRQLGVRSASFMEGSPSSLSAMSFAESRESLVPTRSLSVGATSRRSTLMTRPINGSILEEDEEEGPPPKSILAVENESSEGHSPPESRVGSKEGSKEGEEGRRSSVTSTHSSLPHSRPGSDGGRAGGGQADPGGVEGAACVEGEGVPGEGADGGFAPAPASPQEEDAQMLDDAGSSKRHAADDGPARDCAGPSVTPSPEPPQGATSDVHGAMPLPKSPKKLPPLQANVRNPLKQDALSSVLAELAEGSARVARASAALQELLRESAAGGQDVSVEAPAPQTPGSQTRPSLSAGGLPGQSQEDPPTLL